MIDIKKQYIISGQIIGVIADYLVQKPFGEVNQIIGMLSTLPEFQREIKPEVKQEIKKTDEPKH